jgi:hypothetical protein
MTTADQLRQARTQQLKESAETRAADALARANRAIIILEARGEAITVASVAAQAGVSESYLYKHPDLQQEIRRRRGDRPTRPGRTRQTSASAESLRTQLTVASERLKNLDAEVRRLRQENETLRGEVLELRRQRRTVEGHQRLDPLQRATATGDFQSQSTSDIMDQ